MRQVRWIAFGGHLDALAVDDQIIAVRLDRSLVRAMDRIALEQQCVGLGIGQIVDRDQFKPAIGTFQDGPGDKAANAPEAVDCNFHCHFSFLLLIQSAARTFGAMTSAVSPKYSYSASAGADAPYRSIPKRRPSSPV